MAGAVPLLLAEAYGWNFSYAVMAALMTVGVLAVLAAPREERHVIRPIHAEGIQTAPAREALEWVVRLAILAAGALVLGSGLAANAGVLAGVLNAVGATGAREAVLSAWASGARVWVHLAAVVAGFGVIVLAVLPLPGRAHAARRLSLLRARRSAARFLRALRLLRGAHPGADLPLPHPGLRAEHHEPVLSRPRLQPDRDRRGPEDFRRRHVDGRRICRRGGGGALRAHARDGHRRVRGAVEQSALHLARHAGPRSLRALHRHRTRQRRGRLRGHVPHRVHVEPDLRRVHRHPIRAFFLPLRDSRPYPRIAVGTHRRGCRAGCRCGRCCCRV